MKIKLHPHARAELHAARNWYYERSTLSAFAFAQTVQNATARIIDAPTTYHSRKIYAWTTADNVNCKS